jgi:pimeloyl-ACP methyl ester carboxylesterase
MHIDIGTARIFFDVVGSKFTVDGERMVEKPTLIVMHGGPGFDHSTLRPYFDRFADTHQVIYIDHRGNGRSTGEPDTWTLAQWGDDVKSFCDALGITAPVVYGNSFGGMVAMAYASRHPDHPSKLILSSTAAALKLGVTYRMMQARGGDEARTVAERFWTAPDPAAIAAYQKLCMPLYNPRINPADAQARRRAMLRTEVMMNFILGEMRSMNLAPGLAAVHVPTLILAGVHDPITPVACAEEIAAALPEGIGEFHVFEDAGHGVHRDEPDHAEQVLRRFLSNPSPLAG